MAAIIFTDMVGYTALGQRNEYISLALVDAQRKLIRPLIVKHNGREVKTIGDGFLIEFPNTLDAVRCAYDIQRASRELNFSLPEERRIHLRVGVHVGDVVESEGDISGDAVNVASRIESLAEDGGVCVTQQTYDQVHNKFEVPLRSMGMKSLKNVIAPLEIYRMVMPWSEGLVNPQTKIDKTRIAVLPLANVSPNPADEYFADGLTDELISTISQLPSIQVIARTSVMSYKGAKKGVSTIGHELEAGSVLEGSVRKVANRIRVTTQLVDTETQSHIWASTYDRELDDVFAIQSDIANKVAEALKVRLLRDVKERLDKVHTRNTEAFILYLKGRNYVGERTSEGFKKAIECFEEAVKRDPEYAHPFAGLSDCYHLLENWGFMHPSEAWKKSKEYALKALSIDDALPEAHTAMAMALAIMDWNWKAAEDEYLRAITLNPNDATAHHWYATHLVVFQDRLEEAIEQMRKAYSLDPFSPVVSTNLGRVLYLSGRHRDAIDQYRLTLEVSPGFAYAHVKLGIALVADSRIDEGMKEVERAVEISPDFNEAQAALGFVYAVAGRTNDAEKILERLRATSGDHYVPSTWIGVVCEALGYPEEAFKWLSKAAREHSSNLPEYCSEPMFESVKKDSRFKELLREMGHD